MSGHDREPASSEDIGSTEEVPAEETPSGDAANQGAPSEASASEAPSEEPASDASASESASEESASEESASDGDASEASASESASEESASEESADPASEASASDGAASEASASDGATSEAPVSEASASEASASEAPASENAADDEASVSEASATASEGALALDPRDPGSPEDGEGDAVQDVAGDAAGGPEGPSPSEPSPDEPAAAPPSRLRRWGRRLLKLFLLGVVLGFAARLALPFVLPWVLSAAAGSLGLSAEYEELNLSLTFGEVELRGLRIEREGGGRLVELDHFRCDLATGELVSGRVDVERLDLDGLRIWVERDAQGAINWLQVLEGIASKEDEPPPPPSPEPTPEDADPQAPLLPDLSFFRMRGLRLEGIEVVLRDETLAPPVEQRIVVAFALGPLSGAPEAPATTFSVEARAPGVLTVARAEGQFEASRKGAAAQIKTEFEGLACGPFEELLKRVGITPRARALGARGTFRAELRPLPEEPRVLSVDLGARDLVLYADEAEVAGLTDFGLRVARLSGEELIVERLQLVAARARASRSRRGTLLLAGLEIELPPEIARYPTTPLGFPGDAPAGRPTPTPGPSASPTPTPSASPTPTPSASPAPSAAPGASPGPAAPEPPLWARFRFACRDLSVSDCWVEVVDRVVSDLPLRVELEAFRVKDLSWGEGIAKPASLELRANAPGLAGAIAVVGSGVALGEREVQGDLKVSLEDCVPRRLDPYLAGVGIERRYERGSFTFKADGHFALEDRPHMRGGGQPLPTVFARFSLGGLRFLADGVEQVGLDAFVLDEVAIQPGSLGVAIGAVRVHRPRISVWRSERHLGALGFAYRLPGNASPEDEPAGAPPAPSAEAPPDEEERSDVGERAATESAPPLLFTLGELDVQGVGLAFDDRVLAQAHSLREVGCSLKGFRLDLDGSAPVATHTLTAWLEAPGLVERADATLELHPSLAAPGAALRTQVRGLTLAALKPYLAPLGVETTFQDGSLEARAQVALRVEEGPAGVELGVDLGLEHLALKDRDRSLVALEGARLEGLQLSASDVRVGHLGLGSLALKVAREPDGTLLLPGLRILPAPPSPASSSAEGPPRDAQPAAPPAVSAKDAPTRAPAQRPAAAPPIPIPAKHPLAGVELPRVALERVSVGEVALDVSLALPDAPAPLELPIRVGVPGGPLRFDPALERGAPGAVRLDLAIAGLFERLELTSQLALGRSQITAESRLELIGLQLASLKSTLARAGVELAFPAEGGVCTGRFGVALELSAGEVGLEAWASELALKDARREWLGLDAARLPVRVRADRVHLGPVRVENPRALVRRTARGVEAGGVRILTPEKSPKDEDAPLSAKPGPAGGGGGGGGDGAPGGDVAAQPAGAAPGGAKPAPAPRPAPLKAPSAEAIASWNLPALHLQGVALRGARLRLEDAREPKPRVHGLGAALTLKPAVLDPGLALSKLEAEGSLRIDGIVERLFASGALEGGLREGLRAKGDFGAEQLRAGPLAQLLPPEVGVELQSATLAGGFELSAGFHASQGLRAAAAATKVSLKDGGALLMGWDEARLDLAQLDPSEQRITLAALVFEGFELGLRLDANNALHTAGLRLGPDPSAKDTSQPGAEGPRGRLSGAQAAKVTQASGQAPAARAEAPGGGPSAAERARAERALARASRLAARQLRATLPDLRLERLSIGLKRVSFVRPKAERVVLRDLRLTNTGPLEVPSDDLAFAEPWVFETELGLPPIVRRVKVKSALRPFALDPSVEVEWRLEGLSGEGLRAVAPELKDQLLQGPQALVGSGKARVEVLANRQEPLDLHFAQFGFGARLRVLDVDLRERDAREPYLGLSRLAVDVDSIHPTRGATIDRVEVVRPAGRFRRDAEGVHALGFVIPLPTEGAPAKPSEPTKTGGDPAPAATAGAVQPSTKDTFAVLIRQVVVDQIDVKVVDATFDPPVVIPLDALEVTVEGLGTRLLHEKKSELRLQLSVGAGPVLLPGDERPVDAWDRVEVELRAGLVPEPTATLTVDVRGVQLRNYDGVARSLGAEIKGGQVDLDAQVRLGAGLRLGLSSETTLHDFVFDEGEDGPLRQFLPLPSWFPMPVGAAITVANGAHGGDLRIPVNLAPLQLQDAHWGTLVGYLGSQGARVFGEAFVAILVDAVLAQGKRAVGAVLGVGSAVSGLFTSDPEAPVSALPFRAGSDRLTELGRREVARLRQELLDAPERSIRLEHVLSKEDLQRARRLATPSPRDRLALVRRQEAVVLELGEQLRTLTARAKIADTEDRRVRARALAARLGQAERALEDAYALLDNGRGGERRVSATCISLGERRLKRVRALLLEGAPELAGRIRELRVHFDAKTEAEVGLVRLSK